MCSEHMTTLGNVLWTYVHPWKCVLNICLRLVMCSEHMSTLWNVFWTFVYAWKCVLNICLRLEMCSEHMSTLGNCNTMYLDTISIPSQFSKKHDKSWHIWLLSACCLLWRVMLALYCDIYPITKLWRTHSQIHNLTRSLIIVGNLSIVNHCEVSSCLELFPTEG